MLAKKSKLKKIIYIIPSWYPTKKRPLFGIFIKEQVALFAKHNPDFVIIVGLRNDSDLELSWKNPVKIIFSLVFNAIINHDKIQKKENVTEISNPAFSFRYLLNLFSTNKRNIALHLRNVKLAQKKIGTIQIIHAHVATPGGLIANYLSKRFNIPYLITEHRFSTLKKIINKNDFQLYELSQIIKSSDEIIAVSKAQAVLLENISGKKPLVIPNFIDEYLFKTSTYDTEPKLLEKKKFIFSTLCGLIEKKGIDILLKAIAIWKPSEENVQFIIGGEGYKALYFKKLAEDLRINNLIKWCGGVKRENVPSLLENSNAFVLPSRYESFGIVLIEALACGKPVIATRCGGPEDIVNKNNGILVDVDNAEQLAEAMKYVYANHQEFDRNKIRKDFESRFSSLYVSHKLADLYESKIIIGYNASSKNK